MSKARLCSCFVVSIKSDDQASMEKSYDIKKLTHNFLERIHVVKHVAEEKPKLDGRDAI